jgi:hypothetical protein
MMPGGGTSSTIEEAIRGAPTARDEFGILDGRFHKKPVWANFGMISFSSDVAESGVIVEKDCSSKRIGQQAIAHDGPQTELSHGGLDSKSPPSLLIVCFGCDHVENSKPRPATNRGAGFINLNLTRPAVRSLLV